MKTSKKIENSENIELKEKYHYGFRAECIYDVKMFEKNLKENKLNLIYEYKLNSQEDEIFNDVECELEINLEINQIREIMILQTDSHVMIETIDVYDNYTGERYYQQWN
jgi:hypothetical protein